MNGLERTELPDSPNLRNTPSKSEGRQGGGMDETAYLLRNPENARRLLKSVADLEAGAGKERELIE